MAQITSTTSRQFTLKLNDATKGLIVAVITPVITIAINSLNEGLLTFNWKNIGVTALTAFLAYILKNFLSPAQVVISDQAAVKSIKDGDSIVKLVDTPLDGKKGTTGTVQNKQS